MPDQSIQDRSYEFACRVIRLVDYIGRRSLVMRTIARQVLRSATSVGANLEEAEAGQSKADFIAKSRIALKEARETLYWLRLIAATEIIKATRLAPLIQESRELVAILTSIVRSASASRSR